MPLMYVSNLMNKLIYSLTGEERPLMVTTFSIILCLLLIIFPALKMSLNGGKFNETVVITLILFLVLPCQMVTLAISTMHPVHNSIFDIIFITLLSTAISFIEVRLVSWTAAIIILIVWGIVIASTFIVNWEVISKEDMVFSKGIKKLIAVIWVLLLAYAVKGIVDYLNL